MNVVLDEAVEINVKASSRKQIGEWFIFCCCSNRWTSFPLLLFYCRTNFVERRLYHPHPKGGPNNRRISVTLYWCCSVAHALAGVVSINMSEFLLCSSGFTTQQNTNQQYPVKGIPTNYVLSILICDKASQALELKLCRHDLSLLSRKLGLVGHTQGAEEPVREGEKLSKRQQNKQQRVSSASVLLKCRRLTCPKL